MNRAIFLVDSNSLGERVVLHNWVETRAAIDEKRDFVSTCLSCLNDVWGSLNSNNYELYVYKNKVLVQLDYHMTKYPQFIRDLRMGHNVEKLLLAGEFNELFKEND